MSVTHYQEPKSREKINTFPLFYLGMLIVFAYCVWLVTASVWKGVHQSKNLAEQQATLDQLRLKTAVEQRYLEYQKTDNFIEKQARENFGYAKPGETIVDLPQNKDQSTILSEEKAAAQAEKSEKVVSPYPRLWWQYFFGKTH